MPGDLVGELAARGLIDRTTSPALAAVLQRETVTGYVGFDVASPGLHLGTLLPVLTLVRLQRAGHRPIALLGRAAARVADPGDEREGRARAADLGHNAARIGAELGRFLELDGPRGALVVDDAEWLRGTSLLGFLRDVGKHFTVNRMIEQESVQARLRDPERGLSFSELSRVLLQAYDFLALYDRHGCTLQLGSRERWGSIAAGCELVQHVRGATVHGLTTSSPWRSGGEPGSERLWLDPERTRPFAFYQHWLNVADAEVGALLRAFTLLPLDTIGEIERESGAAPERRHAQRALAREVTDLVHGAEARERAERTTEVLFGGGDWRQLDGRQLEDAFAGSPRSGLPRSALGTAEAGLVAVLAASGLVPSRSAARRAIQDGGVAVNSVTVDAVDRVLGPGDLLADRYVVLRRGKKAYHVVEVKDEDAGGR